MMPVIEFPDTDEGVPDKLPHRSGGGGPGGPGPGPGGGFASFGGSGFYNPLSGGAPRGGGQSRQALLRKTMMGGSLLGDDIPAWLQEGEFVMNPFSAQMFAPQLEEMNAVGNLARGVPQEFAYGGPVRNPLEEAGGYGLGGWLKKLGLPIAALAAPFAGPAIAGALGGGAAGAGTGAAIASGPAAGLSVGPMAAVPATQHFGLGSFMASHPTLGKVYTEALKHGPEALAAGKFGLDQYQQGQAEKQAEADAAMQFYMSQPRGFAFGGWSTGSPISRRPAPPQGQPVSQAQQPGSFTLPGIGSTGRDRQGFVGTYDPRNPWAQRTGTVNPGGLGDLHRLIGQWGTQGAYTPGGNPAYNSAMREQAVNDARAYGEQAYLGADVGGLDPAAAQAYRLQAMSNAGRGVGDAMTRYRADMASRDQEFARQLLNSLISLEGQSSLRAQDLAGAMRLKR